MRQLHKEHFIVNGFTIESNRVYGEGRYKTLHREFELTEPNPPRGEKVDYTKGTPYVYYIEADKDGKFPETIWDSRRKQLIPEFSSEVVKRPDGRRQKVRAVTHKPYYDCKKATVNEFAKLVGIKRPQGRPSEKDKVKNG